MSISKVQMKLGNIWEYGQGYVGMEPASLSIICNYLISILIDPRKCSTVASNEHGGSLHHGPERKGDHCPPQGAAAGRLA
jgi:hypothetical protein